MVDGRFSGKYTANKDSTYFRQLYEQPLITTLSSFSQVTNFVRNPYELINNVDEFVKQATSQGSHNKSPREASTDNKNLHDSSPRHSQLSGMPLPPTSGQEMRTFIADTSPKKFNNQELTDHEAVSKYEIQIPLPTLPIIESSCKRKRLTPLTIEEYMTSFMDNASDIELVERVFYGSMSCNELRTALWPYIFGLVEHRGKFIALHNEGQTPRYEFQDSDENLTRWQELEDLRQHYVDQWKSILPDQETRFSTFRERKSLIERDVIRCDRLHPFYIENQGNLDTLTNILMTYMMYDFDIGYVQGMSDLAGPIIYAYEGDETKSFWVFVEVMKLFRRNFELTQKTIHLQLDCLYKLVKHTDPIFAHYLEQHDSSNCYFAFRAIVCQFKRELMKQEEDDYGNVLTLWDTIWCAQRLHDLKEEKTKLDVTSSSGNNITTGTTKTQVEGDYEDNKQEDREKQEENNESEKQSSISPQNESQQQQNNYLIFPVNINQADAPRSNLSVTEKFVLALCLSMIRRERDIILSRQLDGTDIHLHFIDPKLAGDLDNFIEHAVNIYSYLCNDFDINILTAKETLFSSSKNKDDDDGDSQLASASEGYDLLSDYLIINAASSS